ncbi:hypothetical protein [Desulfovibrio inopinatus]|uniref:hypothetical protein n=1 Tax=Desulfovibrio inopinatus TaxID=102109 RepID=UPI000425E07B|nr:hypothetical protein [Desulfovibrio inopinatus]
MSPEPDREHLGDILDDCANMIAFLEQALCEGQFEFPLTDAAQSGLLLILRSLRERMTTAARMA